MQTPVLVLNTKTQREHGRKAQLSNIMAAKAVSDIIRTTLGPRSMMKMILDPMGGIVLTTDGNAILREVDVSHPSAKHMIELSRTQDEEVGDGTTSVIVLAGELLQCAEPFLMRNMHPRIVVGAYMKAMDEALEIVDKQAVTIDTDDRAKLLEIVNTSLGTKFMSRFGPIIANLAIDAVKCVTVESQQNRVKEIDIKRYARVEKIPGAYLEECQVLDGIMFNKDVVEPGTMKRRIENPRVLLLDSNLEYKKGESQTNIEMKNVNDFEAALLAEEQYVGDLCKAIIALKPTLVFTEKGVSDIAAHFLAEAGISVIRRVRKTDNNRIARCTGATIGHDPRDMKDSDIGTACGLFEVKKIGDEFFTYLVKCKSPKACTILLRGGAKDLLNEMERNLQDAMCVVRSIFLDPRVVPGGGAIEMAIRHGILKKGASIAGNQKGPFEEVATAFEVIPRTLSENCGANTIRLLTELRAKHSVPGGETFGIDGNKGEIANMADLHLWEPVLVKTQTIKTAIEAASMLLKIDDIVSGMRSDATAAEEKRNAAKDREDEETFGDARDG